MNENNSPYLLNAWYVAALSKELDGQALFKRTLLDTPVVFYRKADNCPVALLDRCPHRFAPLSMGHRDGDDIVCPYHGLKFDCSGKCNHNPHGPGTISPRAIVRSFPLLERYGFIWIWMGSGPADESTLPDYSELVSGHRNSVGYTYMPRPCHYELISDNVMDLSHVDHLHGEIITTRGNLSPMMPNVVESQGEVAVRWEWEQTPPIMIFNDFLPTPGEVARHFVEVTWSAPAHLLLVIGATQDESVDELNYENTTAQYDFHTSTPESKDRTHYFFATRRNHNEEDAEFNEVKLQGMHDAFDFEDGPMLDAVHLQMGTDDFFSLNPIFISSDAGPVRVRKMLKKMIESEREGAETA
ncbi:aromatic ring-hydroxylating dioxygenase subunit alpha [Zhongshania sp. BJYM1]|uniref:aromatic ring-hydroxylating dioxygenase subunit alpha n=1 Tax=Zhongshania aquatica TaxID=2965069 RepID=UPI0022B318CB|nr:aromatic ring-hydroxylating dioxygenase subunit alpha [Marortus sp. BJYM1]